MRTAIGFKQYATIHQECEFAFVFIGGGTKKTIKKRIYKLFRGLKNVKCIITDYIFPVPRSLLKKLDICIASSGCAETCLQERVPTIYVNSSNGLPIGIAGFTLDIYNFDFRFATPPKECENLESMLNHMLFEKDYRAFDPIYTSNKIETNEEIEKTFMDQYLFIKEANVLSYYPIDLIHPNGFKQRLYSFFGKCLGINFLSFMHLKVLHTFKTFKRK